MESACSTVEVPIANKEMPLAVSKPEAIQNSFTSCVDIVNVTNPIESPFLLMKVYAENLSKVEKSKERLQEVIEQQLTMDTLTDELVLKLSPKNKNDLKKRLNRDNLHIVIRTDVSPSSIQLMGDCDDVAGLKLDIEQVLRQICAARLMQRKVELLQCEIQWRCLLNNCKS